MTPLTRRQFIGATAGLVVAGNGLALPARGITIHPRKDWAGDNHPPLGPPTPEDVKFLIVHHSASHNGTTSEEAPGVLRIFYNYHTGPKGWNDIAYNFVIDTDGGIWEARSGSLKGPVAGDATGGNQGYTQLVCIIGDYNKAQPSPASLSSLVALLASLAGRYHVPTAPGSEVTFTSRGSNKWPAGASVTTETITGHRTMSKTTCPGDNLNAYVVGDLMADVTAVRGGAVPAPVAPSTTTTIAPATTTIAPATTTTSTTTTTTSTTSTTIPPTTTTTIPPITTSPPSTTTPSSTTLPPTTVPPTTIPPPSTTAPVAAAPLSSPDAPIGVLATAGAMVVTGAGLVLWRYRRMSNKDD